MESQSIGAAALQVSVVLATYRRPELLARCLDALCAQHFDGHDYEIIIADDDGQSGSARAVAERYAQQCAGAPAVRYVQVTRTQGPAGARNVGWRLAQGAIIAFTDDDTIPDPEWLAAGCHALAAAPYAAAAGGRIEVWLPPRPTDYEKDTAGLARAEFATANTFVRRTALLQVGGFDERFTSAWREDSDLMFTLLEQVGPVIQAPHALVLHPVRAASWGVSIRQQAKVYFDALLYKKHRLQYRRRIRARPPWHYYLAVLALLVLPLAWWAGLQALAAAAAALWLAVTILFCWKRLRGTARTPSHVAEMIVTSMLIPPVSLYWRLRGALNFRVLFL